MQKLENSKENFSGFEELTLDNLQTWVMTGDDQRMPEAMQRYLCVLDIARSMYDKYKSNLFIIKTLTKDPYNLSLYMARRVFSDALNFFYSDNEVKADAWRTIYADRLDNLALLAIQSDNYETAQRCFLEAAKLRAANEKVKDVDEKLYHRPNVFYSMRAKDLGFEQVDRRKLAKFIDNLKDIDETERQRIHRDTGNFNKPLFDVDSSEIDNIPLNEDQ